MLSSLCPAVTQKNRPQRFRGDVPWVSTGVANHVSGAISTVANSFTLKIPSSQISDIRSFFQSQNFEFREHVHAHFQARAPGCNATFYLSGKLLLQGKEADIYRGLLGDVTNDARPYYRALQRHPSPAPICWAGTDEAGKGDYFGPLVVAGVAVRRKDLALLHALGVDDSKAIPDHKLPEMDRNIAALCDSEVLMVGPEKYNQLYEKIGNLNRLLAWAHGKVIETLLERQSDSTIAWVLVDQFAQHHVLKQALGSKGQAVHLDQWPRAESDPAVAAASIRARSRYLRALSVLSRKVGVELRPGAGAPTLAAGRHFVSQHGIPALKDVAKLHFATTDQLKQ